MDDRAIHPFEPILFKDTKTVILGSFPSKKSFENAFYYANPRNQFWKIMGAITGYPTHNKDQKLWLLKEAKIGLWDMIKSCKRENSLDSSLEEEEVNDIASLLEAYPTIEMVAFTGRKSQILFEMHFGYLEITRVYLPSPSSAYVKMKFEEKVLEYQKKLGL